MTPDLTQNTACGRKKSVYSCIVHQVVDGHPQKQGSCFNLESQHWLLTQSPTCQSFLPKVQETEGKHFLQCKIFFGKLKTVFIAGMCPYPLEFLRKTFQFTLLHVKPLIFLTNVAINSVIFMHASENSGKGSELNAVFPSQAGQAGVMTIFSPGV